MRRNRRFNIFGLSAVAAALLTTACERELLNEAEAAGSDYVAVTFTIQPEDFSAATRAEAEADPTKPAGNVNYGERHISDGTKADVLVYAVYDEKGELLSEFGQVERGEESCTLPDGSSLGKGQTYAKVTAFPHKITLNVKRDKTYKIAFWAQNSTCKAYDVHDLTKVQIHYTEIESVEATGTNASTTPNNDEMRDAFCKVEELTIKDKSINNKVIYLYRPLAQINVGTTGYDYETVVQDETMNYAYTRIQIASAPRYLNVVTDEIDTDKTNKEKYSVLEYGWALMPAYTNAEWAEQNPDWSAADAKILEEINGNAISSENLQKTYAWEEFLKVKLYKDEETGDEYMPLDGKYRKYAGLKDNNKKTETFKYLSMCYVLAPNNTKEEQNTFDRVRVWIAKNKDGLDEKPIVDITQVPATRNWRTNIVGNILTTDVDFNITLDPIYAGDYNGLYQDGEASWSGPLNGIDGGVFYDAENDEILISNVKGLLWFQQMVNGDLKYRNAADRSGNIEGTTVAAGDWITYYDEKGEEHDFGETGAPYYFRGIPDPTTAEGLEEGTPEYEEAAMLKARILRATHQDTNVGHNPGEGQTWPQYNNFHFVGEKDGEPDPARVKLVADIDLTGIEWLGIGFDCKTEQTRDMLRDNNNNKNEKVETFDKEQHRGFFGHFDGNGHTVSNLTTKRFSVNVHEKSLQLGTGGPYDAVQWYARGFFGQIGGTAKVENLTLHNVDIYGFNCVGGIAGAVVGVKGGKTDAEAKANGGTVIDIDKCIVDGGTITTVPMYRGDAWAKGEQHLRTYARGVNTGGIVGFYNANGSVTDCEVRNLTISGYRTTGGIVGCIGNYYLAYTSTDWGSATVLPTSATPFDSNVKMKAITGNKLVNTIIMSDRTKPFDTMKAGSYKESKLDNNTDWAYGFSWMANYMSWLHNIVGGQYGGDVLGDDNSDDDGRVNTHFLEILDDSNDISGAQIIDFANDIVLDSKSTILGRIVYIDNTPVDMLPVLNNWFCDFVEINSNLVGNAALYKRYETHAVEMFSTKLGVKTNVMWDLPNDYEIDWDQESGRVGMRVGAVDLECKDKETGEDKNYVLSVRGVTGPNDCAVQISSCNRKEFTKTDVRTSDPEPADWDTSAETTLKNLTVRGNPYAYTGICLSPNECMKSITLEGVSVYDVYQTIALDDLAESTGNVWPKKIDPAGVTLTVTDSDLRGYTAPGAGWQSVTYDGVFFETGAYINSSDADPSKRNTCDVAPTTEGTTFHACTFKAPFNIVIAEDASVTFTDCKIAYGANVTDVEITPAKGCTKISVDETGKVSYESAQE